MEIQTSVQERESVEQMNDSLAPLKTWQRQLQEGFRYPEELLKFLDIKPDSIDSILDPSLSSVTLGFPMKVPMSLAQRMEKGNSRDPLLLQVLPRNEELDSPSPFLTDSVGDLAATKDKGVIQKYHGRILVIMTGACAVHCRYCFRRHFPYSENTVSTHYKDHLMKIINEDPTIEEIIFSGGDPLLITNEALNSWAQVIKALPQIKRWRLHSRLLSVLPARFDQGLLEILNDFSTSEKKIILVSHFNHPNEINEEVQQTANKLQKIKITLLNQSVLLRDINDNYLILKQLSEKLFDIGLLPYYLHLLDRTKGTHHFEVSEVQALKIYHELSSSLSGYLVPKLVREIMGEPYKTPIHQA